LDKSMEEDERVEFEHAKLEFEPIKFEFEHEEFGLLLLQDANAAPRPPPTAPPTMNVVVRQTSNPIMRGLKPKDLGGGCGVVWRCVKYG